MARDNPAPARAPIPDPVPPGPDPRTAAVALAIAAAVSIAAPLAQQFEGYVSQTSPDPVGIPTYCYGETKDPKPGWIYSKSECAALLRARMAQDFAPKLAACMPELVRYSMPSVFGALLDASYNAGPAAVCASRMAVAVRGGEFELACNRIAGWYVTAHDRRTGQRIALKGLVNRRNAERVACLKDAS